MVAPSIHLPREILPFIVQAELFYLVYTTPAGSLEREVRTSLTTIDETLQQGPLGPDADVKQDMQTITHDDIDAR